MRSSTPASPLPSVQRNVALDALRGFALLGILLMNIEAFAGPLDSVSYGVDPRLQGADRVVDALVYYFVQGKFYPLFALLFGAGFMTMAGRARMTGSAFVFPYLRRIAVLLAFGLMHALLIWPGDILVTYALLASVLLCVRNLSWRSLFAIGVVLALLWPLFLLAIAGSTQASLAADPGYAQSLAKAAAAHQHNAAVNMQAQIDAYGLGTYAQATRQRVADFQRVALTFKGTELWILGLFLIGAGWTQAGALLQPERFPRLFFGLRWWMLPGGMALMAVSLFLMPSLNLARIVRAWVAFALAIVGGGAMSLGYLAWFLHALNHAAIGRYLLYLAPAGRMALTNYLMQSWVCTTVFYGYGLGFFGQGSRAVQLGFALALFIIQAIVSRYWLLKFRFGPVEWLWRSLTYARWQPFRRLDPA